MMLPSVCAARFLGCTAMPASTAAQKLSTLILPLLRSSETSATPAASVSSLTMVPMPRAVPSRLRFQSDISATTRSRCCMRGTPSVSSSRNATGSLPGPCAISSTKLSAANALWPLPTPRHGDSRAPRFSITCSASLFATGYCGTGEPFITMRSCRGFGSPRDVGHDRSATTRWCQATSLPPASKPASMWCAVIGRNLPNGDVVLARPDRLHRLADRLGEADRVEHDLVVAAPAEAAAEEMLVQRDLRASVCSSFATPLSRLVGRLRADPQLGRFAVGATEAVAFIGSICA